MHNLSRSKSKWRVLIIVSQRNYFPCSLWFLLQPRYLTLWLPRGTGISSKFHHFIWTFPPFCIPGWRWKWLCCWTHASWHCCVERWKKDRLPCVVSLCVCIVVASYEYVLTVFLFLVGFTSPKKFIGNLVASSKCIIIIMEYRHCPPLEKLILQPHIWAFFFIDLF